jgi:hypothetical protein
MQIGSVTGAAAAFGIGQLGGTIPGMDLVPGIEGAPTALEELIAGVRDELPSSTYVGNSLRAAIENALGHEIISSDDNNPNFIKIYYNLGSYKFTMAINLSDTTNTPITINGYPTVIPANQIKLFVADSSTNELLVSETISDFGENFIADNAFAQLVYDKIAQNYPSTNEDIIEDLNYFYGVTYGNMFESLLTSLINNDLFLTEKFSKLEFQSFNKGLPLCEPDNDKHEAVSFLDIETNIAQTNQVANILQCQLERNASPNAMEMANMFGMYQMLIKVFIVQELLKNIFAFSFMRIDDILKSEAYMKFITNSIYKKMASVIGPLDLLPQFKSQSLKIVRARIKAGEDLPFADGPNAELHAVQCLIREATVQVADVMEKKIHNIDETKGEEGDQFFDFVNLGEDSLNPDFIGHMLKYILSSTAGSNSPSIIYSPPRPVLVSNDDLNEYIFVVDNEVAPGLFLEEYIEIDSRFSVDKNPALTTAANTGLQGGIPTEIKDFLEANGLNDNEIAMLANPRFAFLIRPGDDKPGFDEVTGEEISLFPSPIWDPGLTLSPENTNKFMWKGKTSLSNAAYYVQALARAQNIPPSIGYMTEEAPLYVKLRDTILDSPATTWFDSIKYGLRLVLKIGQSESDADKEKFASLQNKLKLNTTNYPQTQEGYAGICAALKDKSLTQTELGQYSSTGDLSLNMTLFDTKVDIGMPLSTIRQVFTKLGEVLGSPDDQLLIWNDLSTSEQWAAWNAWVEQEGDVGNIIGSNKQVMYEGKEESIAQIFYDWATNYMGQNMAGPIPPPGWGTEWILMDSAIPGSILDNYRKNSVKQIAQEFSDSQLFGAHVLPIKELLTVSSYFSRVLMEKSYPQLDSLLNGTIANATEALEAQYNAINKVYKLERDMEARLDDPDPGLNFDSSFFGNLLMEVITMGVGAAATVTDPGWQTPWFAPGPVTPLGVTAKLLNEVDNIKGMIGEDNSDPPLIINLCIDPDGNPVNAATYVPALPPPVQTDPGTGATPVELVDGEESASAASAIGNWIIAMANDEPFAWIPLYVGYFDPQDSTHDGTPNGLPTPFNYDELPGYIKDDIESNPDPDSGLLPYSNTNTIPHAPFAGLEMMIFGHVVSSVDEYSPLYGEPGTQHNQTLLYPWNNLKHGLGYRTVHLGKAIIQVIMYQAATLGELPLLNLKNPADDVVSFMLTAGNIQKAGNYGAPQAGDETAFKAGEIINEYWASLSTYQRLSFLNKNASAILLATRNSINSSTHDPLGDYPLFAPNS